MFCQYFFLGPMTDKFQKGDNDNTLFITSACFNRCIMCCQPPTGVDDSDKLLVRNLRLIENADADTDYVCITGGEPTLTGEKLFFYIQAIRKKMPDASIHLLTNGRRFADKEYTIQFAKMADSHFVLGIPLHSDNPIDHDKIARAKGAFFETMKGLHNLGLLGYKIELRVIIMRDNYKRLSQIAEYITLNLPFVSQVSFMGLEITGYADRNYHRVWVEPIDFNPNLTDAIRHLECCNISAKVFNVPHCLIPIILWPYACKSISAWKKTNLQQCKNCSQLMNCCGVFSTSKRYSPLIHAI